jgi:hypothetical protein
MWRKATVPGRSAEVGAVAAGWDDGLDEARVRRTDEEFFAPGRFPGRHFRRRLRLLMAEAAFVEDDGPEPGPAVFRRLTVPPEDDGGIGGLAFVHVETVALAHHLAEAVWSLLLAAGPEVRSPSVFLAGLTTTELGRRVAEATGDPPVLDRLLRGALLVEEPAAAGGYSDMMGPGLAATGRLLRLAAFRLRDDRRLHNAIKHGFAVAAPSEDISLSVAGLPGSTGPDAEEISLGRAGIWLTVLERRKDPDGTRRWAVVKTALDDLDQEFWFVQMLTHVLDSLWGCTRARHGHTGEVRVRLPTETDVDRLRQQPFAIRRVVFDDLYEDREGRIFFTLYAQQPDPHDEDEDEDEDEDDGSG